MDLIPVNEEIAEFVSAGVSGFVLKDATFGLVDEHTQHPAARPFDIDELVAHPFDCPLNHQIARHLRHVLCC